MCDGEAVTDCFSGRRLLLRVLARSAPKVGPLAAHELVVGASQQDT